MDCTSNYLILTTMFSLNIWKTVDDYVYSMEKYRYGMTAEDLKVQVQDNTGGPKDIKS